MRWKHVVRSSSSPVEIIESRGKVRPKMGDVVDNPERYRAMSSRAGLQGCLNPELRVNTVLRPYLNILVKMVFVCVTMC